jgi:hypothetical protein
VKFTGLWSLLACGIASAATAVATNFFGYNGEYTPELAATCFLVGLIGGWLTLLRLKKHVLRGEDVVRSLKEREARTRLVELRIRGAISQFIFRFFK